MQHIEDTRESPVELGEDEPNLVPFCHWSQIQSPRYKDAIGLFAGSNVTTQKVHLSNSYTKATSPVPACVEYDMEFVQYKLLEILAPYICDIKNAGFADDSPSINEMENVLVRLLQVCIKEAILRHDNAVEMCEKMGVNLAYDPKLMLRSFKFAIGEKHKQKAFLESIQD